MDEVRIGIIGSGFMGRTHAEAFAKYTRGARLLCVYGGTRSEELAHDYSMNVERSLTHLLERSDVDAVVVTTPQNVHMDQVIAAARHRKHVLLEKPMASSVAECRVMNSACMDAGVNLMVGFTQRYRRGNIEAKKVIDAGQIGRIKMMRETMIVVDGCNVYPAWQRQKENGGTLLGYGVHSIDRIRWFTGNEVQSVMAHVVSPAGVEAEYSSMLLLRLMRDQSASLLCDMQCPPPGFPNSGFHSWVIGEIGIIDLDAYGELRAGINGRWEVVFRQAPIDWQKEGKFAPARMQSYQDQNQEFIDSILEHRQPAVTGIDGEKAVEVALAAYESSQQQHSVMLPLTV
jgi:predicted dehydrogenase